MLDYRCVVDDWLILGKWKNLIFEFKDKQKKKKNQICYLYISIFKGFTYRSK